MADVRITFDDSYSDLLDSARATGFLPDLGSIAMFCAALGARNSLRKPARGSRSVRLQVIKQIQGASELLIAIQLNELGPSGFVESSDENDSLQAKLFEDFCNGGLETLRNLTLNGRPLSVVIPELINQASGEL